MSEEKRSTLAIKRDEWFDSDDGKRCIDGSGLGIKASNVFLKNRLGLAFLAGVETAKDRLPFNITIGVSTFHQGINTKIALDALDRHNRIYKRLLRTLSADVIHSIVSEESQIQGAEVKKDT